MAVDQKQLMAKSETKHSIQRDMHKQKDIYIHIKTINLATL